ncbi:MAG TPA: hypothetical protein VKV95_04430 [Terriglobia bacterium]|nr:hypothetical protein [Terriglobia bacterium]
MALPEFEELPFYDRPDLTPYLIHLTKNTKYSDGYSSIENLVSILAHGRIWGSTTEKGFIKGPNPATCFMDVPFVSLKYVLNKDNTDPENPRYEPYGVFVTKKYAYKMGCRPVLYLSNSETTNLGIPTGELWRVVRFEVTDAGWISWLHEREWRCKGDFPLPQTPYGVLVRNAVEARKLQTRIAENPKDFKAKPLSIIPLTILCQGLTQPG